jgi:hypothetical protein
VSDSPSDPASEKPDAETPEPKSEASDDAVDAAPTVEVKADDEAPKKPKAARKKPDRRALVWVLGPVAAFLVFVALILATGTPSSGQLMKQATKSFGQVSRGVFTFSITITPQGSSTASPSTIKLSGPFELVPGKPLPRAKINYTVSSGGRGQTVTLLTTGDKAYSIINGQAYELPATATKELKGATSSLSKNDKSGKSAGLSGINLNFDKWLVNPTVAGGRDIDGTATWRTNAQVNIVNALQDLTKSAGTLGAVTGSSVPALTDADLAQVKKGIKNASVVVYVGKYDRIVRLLDLTMDFSTPAAASAATGGVTGGRMNMIVGISKPNQEVNVEAPKNPLPYKALQSLSESTSAQTGTALDDGLGK